MAENQKHTNRLLKSNVKIDIKSRKKRVRHRHCGTIREPLPSFKKLSTLRNELPQIEQTVQKKPT